MLDILVFVILSTRVPFFLGHDSTLFSEMLSEKFSRLARPLSSNFVVTNQICGRLQDRREGG